VDQDERTYHLAGYAWTLPSDTFSLRDCTFAWVGDPEAPALAQLQMSHSRAPWVTLEPSTGDLVEGLPREVSRVLKRRYYLVEKARDAHIVGVIVGTLGAAGYREAIARVRKAAHSAGKKTYTLLVGKPSPAKLANFPEVDVFVMVADPQGQILDSKEYLAPIITPHEAMLAFVSRTEWSEEGYTLEFDAATVREALCCGQIRSFKHAVVLKRVFSADKCSSRGKCCAT
jgi:diphthamide biosynthesis protein 2